MNYLSYLYGSNLSELSIMLQQLFQVIVLPKNKLQDILKESITLKIKHLEVLGNILKDNNIRPIFGYHEYNKTYYFNTYDLYYDMDIDTIIKININNEKKHITNINMVMSSIYDQDIKNILNDILKDEYNMLKKFVDL